MSMDLVVWSEYLLNYRSWLIVTLCCNTSRKERNFLSKKKLKGVGSVL